MNSEDPTRTVSLGRPGLRRDEEISGSSLVVGRCRGQDGEPIDGVAAVGAAMRDVPVSVVVKQGGIRLLIASCPMPGKGADVGLTEVLNAWGPNEDW